jgi:hypothetical protein
MRKLKLIIFVFTVLGNSFSYSQYVLDTLLTERGTMIIWSNYTWEYLEDRNFDGVMNSYLFDILAADTVINFTHSWDTEVCYPSNLQNDYSLLRDTIWLCAVDDNHSDFVMPFHGIVTSRYGWRKGRPHNGIDINLNTGDTVRAAFSGRVRYAKYNESGFGNLVIIRHYNGLETFYAHLSKHMVVPNQLVNAGDPIGLGGNTGRSFGSHLHFEVRFFDIPINPERLIDFEKGELLDENLFIHRGLFRGSPSYAASTATASVSSPSTSGARYYKVRSGDTLGHIASKHGTTVSKLCSLNGIRQTTVLQIGQTLRVK